MNEKLLFSQKKSLFVSDQVKTCFCAKMPKMGQKLILFYQNGKFLHKPSEKNSFLAHFGFLTHFWHLGSDIFFFDLLRKQIDFFCEINHFSFSE